MWPAGGDTNHLFEDAMISRSLARKEVHQDTHSGVHVACSTCGNTKQSASNQKNNIL